MASFQRKHGRKLLLASIGVATATYIGCEDQTSGNLIAPPCFQDNTCDTSSSSSSGGGAGGQGGMGGQGGSGGQTGGAGGQGGSGGGQLDGGK